MKYFAIIITVIGITLFACKKNPNSPEQVVRQWQQHIDANQFDEAAALSSPATQTFIQSLKQLVTLTADANEAQVLSHTEFKTLVCDTTADTNAVCVYSLVEEGEVITDTFRLVKINGQWLVDIQEQTEGNGGDFFDSLDNTIQQEDSLYQHHAADTLIEI
ncbi:MAG: DUF4878 domain-containing protein [Saprospiraceae bacterium]|nr:DUF4878 domain-containing protein [Saprospiraceae bacterium]MBP7679909.1 DUF4878 domain-containing protein [Saprospiraceae bacterium]